MYPNSPREARPPQQGRYWGRAEGAVDRILLVLGAVSLIGLIPVLWIWLLYGSGFGAEEVYAGAAGLCGVTAGIGFAMIRILEGRR
jgi:hypothetical protein